MAQFYTTARLYINFFQPSFKLKEKRREGAKVIKRYHAPSTPYERALAHPQVVPGVKQQLREQYRTLDPVALLAEIRAVQEELGNRVDRRAGDSRGQQRASKSAAPQPMQLSAQDAVAFAKTLGTTVEAGEPRATHRRPKRPYKTRVRMPSKLDPHLALIEGWLAAEPWLTAIAIVGRLAELHPDQATSSIQSCSVSCEPCARAPRRDFSLRRQLREYENVAHPPGLWTARAMRGPTKVASARRGAAHFPHHRFR